MVDRNSKISIVRDPASWGVYLWQCPDGSILEDESGGRLSLEGSIADKEKAAEKMERAARYYLGDEFDGGQVVFLPGARQISNSEWEDQMERLIDGRIPDPLDALRQIRGEK